MEKYNFRACDAYNLNIRLHWRSSSNSALKRQKPRERKYHHPEIRHCWNKFTTSTKKTVSKFTQSICKWESAHHTVPQLWLPVSLMKNKCWFKSVTVKDPLTNTIVCDTSVISFMSPPALCTSIPACFWLSHLESCPSSRLFIAPWNAFQ